MPFSAVGFTRPELVEVLSKKDKNSASRKSDRSTLLESVATIFNKASATVSLKVKNYSELPTSIDAEDKTLYLSPGTGCTEVATYILQKFKPTHALLTRSSPVKLHMWIQLYMALKICAHLYLTQIILQFFNDDGTTLPLFFLYFTLLLCYSCSCLDPEEKIVILPSFFCSLVCSTTELSLKDNRSLATGAPAYLIHVDAYSLKQVRPHFTHGKRNLVIFNHTILYITIRARSPCERHNRAARVAALLRRL